MNTRNNKTSSYTELMHIGGIGFIFEVKSNLRYNLITPDILTFFDGVPESGVVTENYAFPPAISHTNLCYSIFKKLGYDWATCSDGVFRKCQKVECIIQYNNKFLKTEFYIDKAFKSRSIVGYIIDTNK